MLYISGHDPERDLATWHVGESLPEIQPFMVRRIQADGDELDLILLSFQNLPHTEERVQIWYGDLAATIYANLELKYKHHREKQNALRSF